MRCRMRNSTGSMRCTRSRPASAFGVAIGISILLHLITVYAIALIGSYYGAGTFYWIGAAIFVALLIFQHTIVTPRHLDRIGPTFGLLNGITSVCFATCVIIDLYLRY